MQEIFASTLAWIIHAWGCLVTIATSPALMPAVELLALIFVAIYGFYKLVVVLTRKPKAADFHDTRCSLKSFIPRNGEAAVRMTAKTLAAKGLHAGQKMILSANGGSKDVGVVVQERGTYGELFKDGDIEISSPAWEMMGLKPDATPSSAILRHVGFGWKKLMMQSFDHPDQNVRLAWLLSLWSLTVSTIVGIAISHFHMLMPK